MCPRPRSSAFVGRFPIDWGQNNADEAESRAEAKAFVINHSIKSILI